MLLTLDFGRLGTEAVKAVKVQGFAFEAERGRPRVQMSDVNMPAFSG